MPRKGSLLNDFTGQRFGRLMVVEFAGRSSTRHSVWRCHCDCGAQTLATIVNLRGGNTSSCGCIRREIAGAQLRTHGLHKTAEWESWAAMWARIRGTSGHISQLPRARDKGL
jgi:hypothetical protein